MQIDRALLIRRREERGLFQQDLARAAGISKGHMSDIEAGRRQPSPPLLVKLADVLELSTGDLITEDVT